MTVPKYHELIRPLLDLVADGRPRNLREAAQELAERLSLTDEDLTETLPSGYPRYLNRVGWAKSDLNKTGLIESCGRGLFRISERGSNALPELPPQLDRKYFEARELGSWKSVSAPHIEHRIKLDRIYLQAKRWADAPVGGPDINGFLGALAKHGANRGVFVTTSRFTQDARRAVELPHLRLVLIDGEELARLAVEHNVGVSVKRKIELKRLDTDFFDDL